LGHADFGTGARHCGLLYHISRYEVIVAYPKSKGSDTPEPILKASKLGGEVLPVVAARITISFAAARREVESRGGVMLPFGLELRGVRRICRASCGNGTARTIQVVARLSSRRALALPFAGLVRGLRGRPSKFVGVSSGRSADFHPKMPQAAME